MTPHHTTQGGFAMTDYKQIVDQIRELTRMQEELAQEIASLQDQIKADMIAANVDTINGTDFKITWKSYTKTTFDSKALKNDLPELAAKYSKTSEYKRFLVK
jgi:predicted phage-related endonuclease